MFVNEPGIQPYPNRDEANGSQNWNVEDKTQKIKNQWHQIVETKETHFEQLNSIFVSCPYPIDFFNNNPDFNIYIHHFQILANTDTALINLNNIDCLRGQKINNTGINFSKTGEITFSYIRNRTDVQNYNFEIKQYRFIPKDSLDIENPVWHLEGLL